MKKIFKNLKAKEWAFMGLSAALIVFQVWLDLKLPDYMKEITTLIQTAGSTMKEIWTAGGWMLLCALGSGAAAVLVGFFSAQVAATLSMRLREGLFDKVNSFSIEEINRFSTASLITRSTNDITQIQMMVAMGLQVIVKAPVMAVWAITKILDKSWQWSALTAGAVGILLIMIIVVVAVAMPRFKKIQRLTDNINRVMRENLTGIRVVRAYNAEEYQEKKFAVANDELTQNNLVAFRVMVMLMPVMQLVMNGLSLGIYWIGAILINKAAINMKIDLLSDMVVFSSYAMQVIMAFIMLSMIFMMLPRAAVSIKRISEVLDTQPTVLDPDNPVKQTDIKGEVEFRNVSFRYPDAEEYVLKDVSFKANRGDTVAFIGSTGSGNAEVKIIFESRRPVSAEVDEVKLTLALSNLVENAIKYNVEGGWVKVVLDADHQCFTIEVSDSGIGIPEESIEHIYERFYRVDKSHSREIGGTGLGLAITRNAVLMHRGSINVSSVEGVGTVFTVKIPLTYIA